MSTLSITITTENNTDYDGNAESIKKASATLDGVSIIDTYSIASSVSDADVKTAFKAKLTEKGYAWDVEI
jgi:hypothetical protein